MLVAVWIYTIVIFLLPVLFITVWKKKTGARIKPFWIGMVTFLLFAMVLEQCSHAIFLVLPWSGSKYITDHTWAYALYGCLAAGFFEETGRCCAFDKWLKDCWKRQDAVTYGIGHASCEIICITGMGAVSYLMMLYNPSIGNAAAVSSLSALTLVLGVAERLIASALHISLSIFVFTAVKAGRKRLYLLAIALHMIADVPAVLYQRAVIKNMILVELIMTSITAVIAFFAYKMYRSLPNDGADLVHTTVSADETDSDTL